MMSNLKCNVVLFAAAILLVLPGLVFAQARPRQPTPGPGGTPVQEVLKKGVKLAHALAQTPEYDVNTTETKPSRKNWAVVTVTYETLPEWLDELEFRYFVVVQNKKTNVYTLFPLVVTYIDIPKGKHTATVFLRPNTIERYGAIDRVAVEIAFRGGVIGRETVPASEQRWWDSPNLSRVEGVLLGRSQTPFSFVSWDNYEMEKTIAGR